MSLPLYVLTWPKTIIMNMDLNAASVCFAGRTSLCGLACAHNKVDGRLAQLLRGGFPEVVWHCVVLVVSGFCIFTDLLQWLQCNTFQKVFERIPFARLSFTVGTLSHKAIVFMKVRVPALESEC